MPEIRLDSLSAISSRQNLVTFAGEVFLHQIQLVGLVFYEKNRCSVLDSLFWFLFLAAVRRINQLLGIARNGQVDIESCASARLARHIDEPAVIGNDAVNHRKPETASLSLGFGGEKRFKNTIFECLVYTVPGIRHADAYVLFLPRFLKMLAQLHPADGSRP